jgi:3-phosphoshikimate 1-carboxyvinyltransferase
MYKNKKIIQIPASKSIAQRAIAAALLSDGISIIENFPDCNDTMAALHIVQNLGAKIDREHNLLYIEADCTKSLFNRKDAKNNTKNAKDKCFDFNSLRPLRKIFASLRLKNFDTAEISNTLHAGESALSLRMFAPIAALTGKEIILSGEGSLLNRPVEMVADALRQGGVKCTTNNGLLPLTLSGRLKSGHFHIDGSVTSQVLTGLLMALPVVEGDSVVVVENLKSKPYIDVTLDVLKFFGIEIEHDDYHTFTIRGNQKYTSCRYVVEGDWSSAAFWMVAGAIYGSVSISGLNPNSKQADRAVLNALKKANSTIEYQQGIFISKKSDIVPFTFDASDCPDLIPILTLLAIRATGVSKIYGARRLAHKESDRAAVLIQQFAKAGISILQHDDTLEITGDAIHGCAIDPHNDHRIAMTFAIASLAATSDILIQNTECVNKSYPGFWRELGLI